MKKKMIKTSVKAGGLKTGQHNSRQIKTSVKAGGLKTGQHNSRQIT